MSRNVQHGSFHPDDLVVVKETGREVVLASGGPVMLLETIEGESGLCSWCGDVTVERHVFPLACLRYLSRIGPEHFPELRA